MTAHDAAVSLIHMPQLGKHDGTIDNPRRMHLRLNSLSAKFERSQQFSVKFSPRTRACAIITGILLSVVGYLFLFRESPDSEKLRPLSPDVLHKLSNIFIPGSQRPVDIDVTSDTLADGPVLPGERFFAYYTHSGYHNQRISLENAMTIAYTLNRTLLVPPVVLGTSIPWVRFPKMAERIVAVSKDYKEQCSAFADVDPSDPIPPVCTGFFDNTLATWDLMTDIQRAKKILRMRYRFNMSDEWLIDNILAPKTEKVPSRVIPFGNPAGDSNFEGAAEDDEGNDSDDADNSKDSAENDMLQDNEGRSLEKRGKVKRRVINVQQELLNAYDGTPASYDSMPTTQVCELREDAIYKYRFFDMLEDPLPAGKFAHRIDLPHLKYATQDCAVLQMGSTFGTSRVRASTEDTYMARTEFRLSTVFQNPLVDSLARSFSSALGGTNAYYGLHLRVSDGVFLQDAFANVRLAWDHLCKYGIRMDPALCESLVENNPRIYDDFKARGIRKAQAQKKKNKDVVPPKHPESLEALKKIAAEKAEKERQKALLEAPIKRSESSSFPNATHVKRQEDFLPWRPKLVTHEQPTARPIRTESDLHLDRDLRCHKPLHTDPELIPLNTPLFIATDSKAPDSDPHIALFFELFPCVFSLGDFLSRKTKFPGISDVLLWRNSADKVPLGRFMIPQLDAQVAAMSLFTVGTEGSTFSRFVEDVLYNYYHDWPIFQRG